MQYTTFKRGEKVPESVSEKTINHVVDQALEKQSQVKVFSNTECV